MEATTGDLCRVCPIQPTLRNRKGGKTNRKEKTQLVAFDCTSARSTVVLYGKSHTSNESRTGPRVSSILHLFATLRPYRWLHTIRPTCASNRCQLRDAVTCQPASSGTKTWETDIKCLSEPFLLDNHTHARIHRSTYVRNGNENHDIFAACTKKPGKHFFIRAIAKATWWRCTPVKNKRYTSKTAMSVRGVCEDPRQAVGCPPRLGNIGDWGRHAVRLREIEITSHPLQFRSG